MDAHRLAEARSLAFHRAVVDVLERDPSRVREARERVARWISDGSVAYEYASEWARLLDGPFPQLRSVLLDEGEEARALRQSTPFAGFVDPRTRWKIWADVRASWSGAS